MVLPPQRSFTILILILYKIRAHREQLLVSVQGDSVTGTVDKRMQANFLVGPQFTASGARLLDPGSDGTDPDGNPLTLTPYINELEPNAWRQSGARIGKWQFYQGMTTDIDNDFAIFRYADILLTKAEATARKNNNWNDPEVLAVVNQIRTQHGGVTPFATLTAANFLAERGREMFSEGIKKTGYDPFWNLQQCIPVS